MSDKPIASDLQVLYRSAEFASDEDMMRIIERASAAEQRVRELEQELDSETRRFSARCMELERIIESRVPRAEE